MRPWHLVRTFKKGYEADRDGVEVQLEIYDAAKTHTRRHLVYFKLQRPSRKLPIFTYGNGRSGGTRTTRMEILLLRAEYITAF
jgi:hypothetical protein